MILYQRGVCYPRLVLPRRPLFYWQQKKTLEIKVLSGTNGIYMFNENLGSYPTGRQNWRQLLK